MSRNTDTVARYIEGFNAGDHALVLSCLTDDVEWVMPGGFQLAGKEAFDREIENDAFTGKPVVTIARVVEQNDVVVAEGTVRAHWKSGGVLNAVFCDVFEMHDGKIRKLITYLVNLDANLQQEPSTSAMPDVSR